MRPSRWAISVLVTGTALAASAIWVAGTTASAQPPAATTATAQPSAGQTLAAATLAQRVTQRRPLLERREFRRLEILNRLEFAGRLPFPFPDFPILCLLPRRTAAAAIDPHRSLFVHDRATLDAGNFSLARTLGQIAAQAAALVPGLTAERVFGQLWDTQNNPPGVFPPGPHCTGTLNGFPINCPRTEGQEALNPPAARIARMGEYQVIGLVNRLDLAHQGWRNCGEHRIVYGKQDGFRKNFIIFEAVLPNPRPGCREGCVPVAEFWKSLSTINDPAIRAARLEQFFYTGLPGFRPVVHVDHYSATGVTTGYGSSGSGQIRTNQFLQNPWMLKEFKTVIDCGGPACAFAMVPIMVKVNPHGPLWNEDNAAGDPRAADFQADTVAQLTRLQSATMSGIGYDVDLVNDAGQSMSSFGFGFVDDYRTQMNNALLPNFRAALAVGPLTADQIARRALTQSCAGCHMPGTFGLDAPNSIGAVTTPVGSAVPVIDSWPEVIPAGFAHTDTQITPRPELLANPAAFGAGNGHELSPALLDFFLPDRKNFLLEQLNLPRCRCVNRFRFLTAALQARALQAQAQVQKLFADRLLAVEQKITEARVSSGNDAAMTVMQEKERLLAERDKALLDELQRAGIKLPDDQASDLRPQSLKLRAATAAKGDARRTADLRVLEVNQALRADPPRRTVTGSFRVH
jgi:hypothetical protein